MNAAATPNLGVLNIDEYGRLYRRTLSSCEYSYEYRAWLMLLKIHRRGRGGWVTRAELLRGGRVGLYQRHKTTLNQLEAAGLVETWRPPGTRRTHYRVAPAQCTDSWPT